MFNEEVREAMWNLGWVDHLTYASYKLSDGGEVTIEFCIGDFCVGKFDEHLSIVGAKQRMNSLIEAVALAADVIKEHEEAIESKKRKE